MRACVRACVRALRACVRACVRVCVCVCVWCSCARAQVYFDCVFGCLLCNGLSVSNLGKYHIKEYIIINSSSSSSSSCSRRLPWRHFSAEGITDI